MLIAAQYKPLNPHVYTLKVKCYFVASFVQREDKSLRSGYLKIVSSTQMISAIILIRSPTSRTSFCPLFNMQKILDKLPLLAC